MIALVPSYHLTEFEDYIVLRSFVTDLPPNQKKERGKEERTCEKEKGERGEERKKERDRKGEQQGEKVERRKGRRKERRKKE